MREFVDCDRLSMETEYARSRMMGSGEKEEDDLPLPLPGFRFHPTDEELVGFYLRRKVDKRPIRLDLIKLLDIYKFDPWDLPRKAGEREWYFFCRRGRKYKNSMRPNRVTRSGFWKATGIDRPIYSSTRDRECIGLKKSLVYYRGAAGKGTKTDWMMHEFRLPTALDKHIHHHHPNTPLPQQPDAEVWTLCRILKRGGVSYRKDWRETAKRNNPPASSSETCSVESAENKSSYISFREPSTQSQYDQLWSSSQSQSHQPPSSSSSYMYGDINELLRNADWEDLRSVVDSATNPNFYL